MGGSYLDGSQAHIFVLRCARQAGAPSWEENCCFLVKPSGWVRGAQLLSCEKVCACISVSSWMKIRDQCPYEGMKENFPSSDGCDFNRSKISEPRVCAGETLSLARRGEGGCFCYKE